MTTTGGGGTAARRAARQRTQSGRASRATPPSEPSVSGSRARRIVDPDRLAALEEERDFLLRSLADLEREHAAGDVDDEDYVALTDDYTARAAAVLRAIDDRERLVQSSRPRRDWRRTAVALVTVGVLATGAGWFVFRDSGARAPGQGLTGDVRQDSANLILQAQGLTGQAQAALQAGDPDKAVRSFQSAIETYSRALELSPGNVEAITYRAWVLHTVAINSEAAVAAELDQQARRGLDEAIAVDPTYSDARVFRAILGRNAGQWAAAQADLDAVDMTTIPPFMTSMVNSVRADVAARRTG
ncbi:MAG: hypothetical protein FGM58_06725 [Acidimicrobiia bacterium]|nr:hypothetical protein [Acidimicrobiia bacterium]